MRTKNHLKPLVVCLLIFGLQTNLMKAQRTCGVDAHEQYLRSIDLKREGKMKEFRNLVDNYVQNNQKTNSVATVTLPVVVHVVYNTVAQNISNAQVFSQIDVINEDFGRYNADTINTPAAFKTSASYNMQIQFCLAQRDPFGNPTNGIERRSTTIGSFSTDDKVKFFSQGGLDAWDPTRYINIWVCNFGGGLLGYGEFPTGSVSLTYGSVMQYDAFGRVGTVSPPFHLGRTTSHEIGHCFNLFHIWGDDGSACTGSDLCGDTPNQAGATSGCLSFPSTDACSPTSPGFQFMNYMDYSDDNCMNMFTNNQATRMNNVLNVPPYSALKTSNGCVPVILQVNDAGVPSVINPSGSFCNTTFTPNVVVKNWGTANLTVAIVNYRIDTNPVQTFTWTGSLASLATATVSLPSISTTIGSHTFTAYSTNPNSTTDGNYTNDTTRTNFSILGIGQPIPIVEGFEAVTFPPTGFSLYNPDASYTWARTTAAAFIGTASAIMDNYNYTSGSGQSDELVLPSLNLTTALSPLMTFDVAYKLYTNPALPTNYSDTLEVLISTDCGATFTSIYKKAGTVLTTATPNWANNAFVPTLAQWRNESISLVAYGAINNAIIKFRNASDYENYLYLDNINIAGGAAIYEASESNGINIFPNPSLGLVNIKLQQSQGHEPVVITVLNSNGQQISKNELSLNQATISLDLNKYADGLYVVQVLKDGVLYKKKIALIK